MTVRACPRCETLKDIHSETCLICGYSFAEADASPRKGKSAAAAKPVNPKPLKPVAAGDSRPVPGAAAKQPSIAAPVILTVLSYGFAVITPGLLGSLAGWYMDMNIMLLISGLASMLLPLPIWSRRMVYPLKTSSRRHKLIWVIPLHFFSVFVAFGVIEGLENGSMEPLAIILITFLIYLFLQLPIILSK